MDVRTEGDDRGVRRQQRRGVLTDPAQCLLRTQHQTDPVLPIRSCRDQDVLDLAAAAGHVVGRHLGATDQGLHPAQNLLDAHGVQRAVGEVRRLGLPRQAQHRVLRGAGHRHLAAGPEALLGAGDRRLPDGLGRGAQMRGEQGADAVLALADLAGTGEGQQGAGTALAGVEVVALHGHDRTGRQGRDAGSSPRPGPRCGEVRTAVGYVATVRT